MLPLFEMLTSMQKQAMPDAMARQFGLDPDQAQKAMEALMPAFSQGLKRNAANPAGFAGFMQALASGRHADYFNEPERAFSASGMQEGNAILGHLFGSKDVSRAIAKQAEAATGISQSILKQMLPALAPVILGGLFQQMTGGGQGAGQATGHVSSGARQASASANPFGRILEELMKGGFGGPASSPPPSGRAPSGRSARSPLEEILEQMMGGGRPGGQAGGGSQPGGPLGDIFTDMLRNGPAGGGHAKERPREFDESKWREPSSRGQPDPYGREPEAGPAPRGGGLDDLFGEMFETGRDVNRQYRDSIESIFDEFLGPRR